MLPHIWDYAMWYKVTNAQNDIIQGLVEHLISCDSKIFVEKNISSSQLQQITYYLKSTYPALFHLSSFLCEQKTISQKTILYPQYICSKDQYAEYKAQISNKIKHVKSKLTTLQCFVDKEAYVHDYLCTNVSYFDNDLFSHCLVGPLLYGCGVCDGISQAAQFLLKAGGIRSYIVFGEAKNFLQSNFLPHAWNVIELDNKWYHLDVTFDLCLSNKSVRYDYYNLCNTQISNDHRIKYISSLVDCYCENDYYFNKHLVFSDFNILRKYFSFAISQRKSYFQFRFDAPYDDKLYQDIIAIWNTVVQKNNLHIEYQLSINYCRSIFSWEVQYQ